jgi:hypothetical protein
MGCRHYILMIYGAAGLLAVIRPSPPPPASFNCVTIQNSFNSVDSSGFVRIKEAERHSVVSPPPLECETTNQNTLTCPVQRTPPLPNRAIR